MPVNFRVPSPSTQEAFYPYRRAVGNGCTPAPPGRRTRLPIRRKRREKVSAPQLAPAEVHASVRSRTAPLSGNNAISSGDSNASDTACCAVRAKWRCPTRVGGFGHPWRSRTCNSRSRMSVGGIDMRLSADEGQSWMMRHAGFWKRGGRKASPKRRAVLECGGLTPLLFCVSFGMRHGGFWKCGERKRHSQSGVKPPHSEKASPGHTAHGVCLLQ